MKKFWSQKKKFVKKFFVMKKNFCHRKFYNLKKCFENSNKGIIFSLQNSTSPKIVNNIYYTSRILMEKKLKEIFKNVYSFYFKSTPNDVYFVILRN